MYICARRLAAPQMFKRQDKYNTRYVPGRSVSPLNSSNGWTMLVELGAQSFYKVLPLRCMSHVVTEFLPGSDVRVICCVVWKCARRALLDANEQERDMHLRHIRPASHCHNAAIWKRQQHNTFHFIHTAIYMYMSCIYIYIYTYV